MKNLAFHILLRFLYQFSLPHLYISLEKVGRMYFLSLGLKELDRSAWLALKIVALCLQGPVTLRNFYSNLQRNIIALQVAE